MIDEQLPKDSRGAVMKLLNTQYQWCWQGEFSSDESNGPELDSGIAELLTSEVGGLLGAIHFHLFHFLRNFLIIQKFFF